MDLNGMKHHVGTFLIAERKDGMKNGKLPVANPITAVKRFRPWVEGN
jgi:hypothetical protein